MKFTLMALIYVRKEESSGKTSYLVYDFWNFCLLTLRYRFESVKAIVDLCTFVNNGGFKNAMLIAVLE